MYLCTLHEIIIPGAVEQVKGVISDEVVACTVNFIWSRISMYECSRDDYDGYEDYSYDRDIMIIVMIMIMNMMIIIMEVNMVMIHTAELSQPHSSTSSYVSRPSGRILSSPSRWLSPVFPSLHHWVRLALRVWIGKRWGEVSSTGE
jgi:hypothetical protein